MLDRFFKEKDQIYKDLARGKLQVFPGILQFINHLTTYGYQKSVASSGTLDKILFSLNVTGIKQYFSIVTSSDEVEYGKPAPDLFLLTAQKMGIDPKHCLVIEDSLAGIEAGISAGMFTVGITNTFSRENLGRSNPNLIIQNVMELT